MKNKLRIMEVSELTSPRTMLKLTQHECEIINKLLSSMDIVDHVIENGIEGLIKNWTEFVNRCKEGYEDNFDEYTNDLSSREIIQDLIDTLDSRGLKEKILSLISNSDTEFERLLIDRTVKSWPIESNDKKKYFWCWGVIKTAKGDLLSDLRKFQKYKSFKIK